MYNLFIYGTLMEPTVFRAVLGRNLTWEPDFADGVNTFYASPAVLNGYKKISPDSTYQYAVPDKGHRIRGYLVRGLPKTCFPALKEYEGRNYSKRTLEVQTNEGPEKAVVFVGNLKELEHHFGHAFRDPLKQEFLLRKKIDAAIREAEHQQLHTDEELTRRAVEELQGTVIRDITRRHFEAGGISDYAIRHALRDRIRDYDRIAVEEHVLPFAANYLRLVIRQVVFNQVENRVRDEFRYELDHLPQTELIYERIISSLVALRILNQCKNILDVLIADTLGDLEFTRNHLVDYVRRGVAAADVLYDAQLAKAQLNFVRGHMGFGHIPLGAELEFSNIGHEVIRDPSSRQTRDMTYDGFLYFYDFGLDVLTWKLGGHVDDHLEKAPGKPRRGFFEVALGNLSIESNLSKPITRDPWVLNQLIHQTRRFYDIIPHSVHISMQPRSQHKPDRNRMPSMAALKCLFAIAGDPVRDSSGKIVIRRLFSEEIAQHRPQPNLLFCEIAKRYSRQSGEAYLPGDHSKEGRYVQQFRFLRLSSHLNYEPIIMALKGIQISQRPGTFLTPAQYKNSRRHRKVFEELTAWGRSPAPIGEMDMQKFLCDVEEGLLTEKRGKPAHSRAYISWSLSQLQEMLQHYNAQFAM